MKMLTDEERSEALLHMVECGVFDDGLALSRWSITTEAVPILRHWLAEGRQPIPVRSEDIDIEAATAELRAQDALAADINARFSSPAYHAGTVIGMFESGWFGQTPAFWRWVETKAAIPYIAAYAAIRRAPQPGEMADVFALSPAARIMEDPDLLDALATSIEAEFGDGTHGLASHFQ